VTAHRRAWTLRAGLVALLAAGGLFGIASPAFAGPGDPTITNFSLDNADLQPGGQATMTFTVNGATGAQPSGSTTVTITSSLAPDVQVKVGGGCTGGTCSSVVSLDTAGATKDFTVNLIAAKNPQNVQPGQQKSGSVKISVNPTNGNPVSKTQGISLAGGQQSQGPQTVTQVSGFVKDVATGAPIPGATVTLQDSSGHNFTIKTSNLGQYVFHGNASTPIAPGVLAVGAQKTGYGDATPVSANVQAGQSYTFSELRMEAVASAGPSDIASVPVVAPPSNDVSVAPLGGNTDAAGGGGGGGFSLILIIAGVLLVLLGIGAIALILMRRRRDDGEGDEDLDDRPPPRRGPAPVPASRGSYRGAPDATAVVRGGGYADPTMVGRGPSLADAPTTMHRPVPADEYPDPYGAPPPRSPQPYGGGYESGGYGDRHGGDYGGGYDDRRGGGGGGEYGGGASAPYGGIYGQPEEPPRGYGSGSGYDSPPSPRGAGYRDSGAGPGYGAPDEYDAPSPRGGGYGSGGGGGHRDSDAGYGGPSRGGPYPPADEYDDPRGYDRRGNQPPPPEPRGRLDWLDD
jgi:hypothetical protein